MGGAAGRRKRGSASQENALGGRLCRLALAVYLEQCPAVKSSDRPKSLFGCRPLPVICIVRAPAAKTPHASRGGNEADTFSPKRCCICLFDGPFRSRLTRGFESQGALAFRMCRRPAREELTRLRMSCNDSCSCHHHFSTERMHDPAGRPHSKSDAGSAEAHPHSCQSWGCSSRRSSPGLGIAPAVRTPRSPPRPCHVDELTDC